MEEVRKENEKRERILELKEAIKKAEAEWNTSEFLNLMEDIKIIYERIFKNKN